MEAASPRPFLARHEFLIRRLHSLSGLVPVGAFMVVHLTVNSTVLSSPGAFQQAVYRIHSLGSVLPLVEWAFIFLPILFHGLIGVLIFTSGFFNAVSYPYGGNIRYTLQRITGILALVFILWHVFHMHGWFHWEGWLQNVAVPLGGAEFRPFNAASTMGLAMQGILAPSLYAIGVLSCVFHLANGIWTMGITWGVWTAPSAQRQAGWLCLAVGVVLGAIAAAAWVGAVTVNTTDSVQVENRIYEAKVAAGEIRANPHKRSAPHE